MNNPFAPGDTVILKSGGPGMTVTEVSEGICKCTWFDEKKTLHTEDFHSVVLMPFDDFYRVG